MDEFKDYQQLGIGGVIAMSLFKLLDFISKRSSGDDCGKLLATIIDLEKAINAQTNAIREQTKATTVLFTEAKLNSQALARVTTDVAQIRNNCPRFPSVSAKD